MRKLILAIGLIALAIPAIAWHQTAPRQMTSKEASSATNLKQLGLATLMYTQDWNERLPSFKSAAIVKKELWPYTKVARIFMNPIDGQAYAANATLSGKSLSALPQPPSIVVMYEGAAASDGTRGVLFLDGHVSRLNAKDWAKYKQLSKIGTGGSWTKPPVRKPSRHR